MEKTATIVYFHYRAKECRKFSLKERELIKIQTKRKKKKQKPKPKQTKTKQKQTNELTNEENVECEETAI